MGIFDIVALQCVILFLFFWWKDHCSRFFPRPTSRTRWSMCFLQFLSKRVRMFFFSKIYFFCYYKNMISYLNFFNYCLFIKCCVWNVYSDSVIESQLKSLKNFCFSVDFLLFGSFSNFFCAPRYFTFVSCRIEQYLRKVFLETLFGSIRMSFWRVGWILIPSHIFLCFLVKRLSCLVLFVLSSVYCSFFQQTFCVSVHLLWCSLVCVFFFTLACTSVACCMFAVLLHATFFMHCAQNWCSHLGNKCSFGDADSTITELQDASVIVSQVQAILVHCIQLVASLFCTDVFLLAGKDDLPTMLGKMYSTKILCRLLLFSIQPGTVNPQRAEVCSIMQRTLCVWFRWLCFILERYSSECSRDWRILHVDSRRSFVVPTELVSLQSFSWQGTWEQNSWSISFSSDSLPTAECWRMFSGTLLCVDFRPSTHLWKTDITLC